MKKVTNIITLVLLFLSIAPESYANLRVSLRLDPVSAIEFETVTAYVSIVNDGDEIFTLDESEKSQTARFFFIVERKRDEYVKRLDERPPLRKMRLMPGEKREFITDVSAFYDVTSKGRYVIKAAIDAGKFRYESNPVVLDVVRGIELASVTRSIPGYSDRDREYSLRYNWREKKEILFLCVYEDDGKTNYGIFPLGPVIRVAKPIFNIDRSGNVTVIHQTNRDCFIRSKFQSNQDGVFFVDQAYLDVEGKPYAYLREPGASPK